MFSSVSDRTGREHQWKKEIRLRSQTLPHCWGTPALSIGSRRQIWAGGWRCSSLVFSASVWTWFSFESVETCENSLRCVGGLSLAAGCRAWTGRGATPGAWTQTGGLCRVCQHSASGERGRERCYWPNGTTRNVDARLLPSWPLWERSLIDPRQSVTCWQIHWQWPFRVKLYTRE